MTNLSSIQTRRRFRVSLPVLIACLAPLGTISAETTGGQDTPRSVADESPELLNQPISLTTKDVSGAPGEAIPLSVNLVARAGRSVSSAYLVGLPKGAHIADADHVVTTTEEHAVTNEDETVIDISDWDLPRLSVMLPSTRAGSYTLTLVAVSRPDEGALNFARSTFTLNAVAASPESARAPDERMRLDSAIMQEAVRPPERSPPAVTLPSSGAVQIADITPKKVELAPEVAVPQALTSLPRERELDADARPSGVVPSLPVGHRSTELLPAAALVALPTVGALPPIETATAPQPAAAAEVNVKSLIERAERLIRLGDISGARLVLERAADRGNPQASFLLAQTWDPRMLRTWKVHGLRPDPDRARALYAKAGEEGSRESKPVNGKMR